MPEFCSAERDGHVFTITLERPEVILLSSYGGVPRTEVAFSRRNLYRRDGFCCQYCNRSYAPSKLSIDHVLPRSRGGRTTWENCVLACVRCNRKKGSRLPHEVGMHLLHKPVRPNWTPMLELPLGRVRQSWERFVSDRYWDIQLETD